MAPPPNDADARHMRRALALAARARGLTSPNPLVGCVVVRDGRVVGEGYHRRVGGPHAEVHALRAAGAAARGATLYLTLEPCAHHGRTPPCVDAVLAAGPRRVVVAMRDPNPLVAGRSLRRLRAAGIEVDVGLLGDEARALNAPFVKHMTTGLPYVVLKAALTLDGKAATRSGHSQWITGEAARAHAHRWRGWVDAIVVGVGTILADDPALTQRLGPRRLPSPTRIVLDPDLRTPPGARIFEGPAREGVWILAGRAAPAARAATLEARGARIVRLARTRKGAFSWRAVLRALGRRGVQTLLVEGGPGLWTSAHGAGVVDRYLLYYAPKILGGAGSRSAFGGADPRTMDRALGLRVLGIERLGEDWVVDAVRRDA